MVSPVTESSGFTAGLTSPTTNNHNDSTTGIASQTLSSPEPSTINISVKSSTGPTAHEGTRALGVMTGQNHPNAISFTFKVRFMGKSYACTLTLPTLKLTKDLSETERKELEQAAEMHKDLCLKDLEAKANGKIHGGHDFKIFFTETGYTACVPSANAALNFDPGIQSLKEAKKKGYFRAFVDSEDEVGRTLAIAANLGSGAEILKHLKTSGALAPLRGLEKPEPSIPVGLIRDDQQCSSNSAFSLWVTNPKIGGELLENPHYLKGGKSNPLYAALDGYQKSRKTKEPFNLNELIPKLGFNASEPGDVDDVLKAFIKQLDYSQIPKDSPLCLASRRVGITPGQNLQQILIEKYNQEPIVESEQFESPPGVLSVCLERDFRSTEPVDVGLTMTLPAVIVGEEAEYELTGFSVHSEKGKNSHYVTYIREGKSFYRINDTEVKSLSLKEFLTAAKSAYVYIYNKKTASSEVETEVQNKQITQAKVGQTQISLESGKLSSVGPEFALVNPTNTAVTDFHSEINPDEIGPRTTREKMRAASRKWFGKNTFTLSDGTHFLYDLEPGVLQVPAEQEKHAVFHVVLPSNPTKKNVKNAVKAVLKEAQNKSQTHVAFPLFTCPGIDSNEVREWMREAVVEFAGKNQTKVSGIQEVKILVPAQKAPPKLRQLFKYSVGAQTLTIKERPSSETKLPTDFDPTTGSAISRLTDVLGKAEKNIELIVPEGADISELCWEIERLEACLKAGLKPARGKVILVENMSLLRVVVESGSPIEASETTSSLSESYALFTDDDSLVRKDHPNAEYLFDLRNNAKNVSTTNEFISLPAADQTLEKFLEKLQQDPPPSARKVRIVLPFTLEMADQLKKIQAAMQPISDAIQKKSKDVGSIQQLLASNSDQQSSPQASAPSSPWGWGGLQALFRKH